jgi:RNA polymerase sigma-70 factor (ECF subfamily)
MSSILSVGQLVQPDSSQTQAPPIAQSELEREIVALYDEHRHRLLNYVAAFGISSHDSEEVVQEVFLSLFRHLQMGKSRRNLRGWIFRVAHNLALKQRQANQRQNQRMETDEYASETHRDPDPTPEERVVSAQRQRRLLSVVSALPEQDQWCLWLRAEGLRYREIAEVLGISLGSVAMSLTRSVARLTCADDLHA